MRKRPETTWKTCLQSMLADSGHSFGQVENKYEYHSNLDREREQKRAIGRRRGHCLAFVPGSDGVDGIPQSVGHIMTFYCVVRWKSAYYACATASAATSAALPLIVGCPKSRTWRIGQARPAESSPGHVYVVVVVYASDCFTN